MILRKPTSKVTRRFTMKKLIASLVASACIVGAAFLAVPRTSSAATASIHTNVAVEAPSTGLEMPTTTFKSVPKPATKVSNGSAVKALPAVTERPLVWTCGEPQLMMQGPVGKHVTVCGWQ